MRRWRRELANAKSCSSPCCFKTLGFFVTDPNAAVPMPIALELARRLP